MTRAEWSAGAAGPVLSLFDELTEPDLWQDRALCAEVDPALFFPEKGQPSLPAQRICASCPVIDDCREFILQPENEDAGRFGVWGGLSERERRQLKLDRAA
jgi:WhiB family transcriptional regulator, redox-sensing transcriptional regulator